MKTLCTVSFLLNDKEPGSKAEMGKTLRSNLEVSVLKHQDSLLMLARATVLSTWLHYPCKKVHIQVPTASFRCKSSLCFTHCDQSHY